MGAFTVTGVLGCSTGDIGRGKRVVLTATGPASYDTNGSLIDLSSVNTTLTGFVSDAAMVRVTGVKVVGVSPAASDRYHCTYIPAALGAPATGLIKVRDLDTTGSGSTDGVIQVASTTDLSGTTFYLEVTGA